MIGYMSSDQSNAPIYRDRVMRTLRQMERSYGKISPEHAMVLSFGGWMWIKRWEKSTGLYVMQVFSQSYGLDLVGPTWTDYIGRDDFQFWGKDVGLAFWKNDEQTRAMLQPRTAPLSGVMTPRTNTVREYFKSPMTGLEGHFVGDKWAFESECEI
mgnify:CR=1 FL=1